MVDNRGRGSSSEGRVEKNTSRASENNAGRGKKDEKDFRDPNVSKKVNKILGG